MQMAWGLKVSEPFCERVLTMCDNLGWPRDTHASYFMSCSAWETGESFSPSVRNGAGSGAIGLIQFMETTAHGLGTTTQQLMRMTAVEQLDYVEKYFKPYAGRIHTLSDMYMTILMPKYIPAPEDTVVFADGTIAYKQNKGFDVNHDGNITKLEATSKVQAKFDKGMQTGYVRNL